MMVATNAYSDHGGVDYWTRTQVEWHEMSTGPSDV